MAESILIYAQAPLHRDEGGGLWVESQAVQSLRHWAANFDRVICMMPLAPGPPPRGWVAAASEAEALDRVRLEALPMAWRPDRFLRQWRPMARRIRGLIAEARYLSFAIGGLWGDWGSVAALEARAMGRSYAVWMDRVESRAARGVARAPGPWRVRLRARLYHRPMAALERAVVGRAALGFFQGQEVFAAMAPHCRGPAERVDDAPVGPDARSDAAVFRHASGLIKRHLAPA